MPDGITAALPASPVNQPSAAADVPSADASVSAGVPPPLPAFTDAATPAPHLDIRVAAGADALTAPLAPAATPAPAANRHAAPLPVSPDDTMANASQPPIRGGAENQPRVSMSRPANPEHRY